MKTLSNDINVIQAPIGLAKDVKTYRRGRRCKLCKCLLGRYTPRPYCLVHGFKGALMKIDEETQRAERAGARYRKMMRERAKVKRRGKK